VIPTFWIGTISQRAWRGVGGGALDDCWACADAMCLNSVTPWDRLDGVGAYRKAAGVPDTASGSEGGSLDASLKGVKALHPKLGPMMELYRGSFAGFLAKVKAGHPASASVWSRALGYATEFKHRIVIYWNGSTLKMLDPLWPAYREAQAVSEAFVKKALADYPGTAEANALLFPTVEQAFTTHPLYSSTDASEQQLAAAKSLGFKQGRDKAAAAAGAVTEV
jgi:hypothetical protein